MAVIIPVVSKFDDKGLKNAQKEFGKLGKSMKTAIGAVGLGVGLAAIATGLKQAAKAAAEDQKSQALLANQLRNSVGANEGQIASVEESIRKMQMQASVADDVIRPAFASLVRATGDVEQATNLTSLALDVAAGTGKDLGAVSLALGKAVNGSSTSLLKLVPSIKGASDPMGELAKQFKGSAEEAAKNDPFQRLNIIFGELQEQVGVGLLPILNDLADYFSSVEFSTAFSDLAVALYNVGAQIDSLSKQVSGKSFLTMLADLASAAAVGLGEILFVLGDIGTTMGFIFSGQWGKAGDQMGSFFTRYNKFVDGIYKEQDKAAAAAANLKPFGPFTYETGNLTDLTGSDKAKTAADKAAKARQAIIDAAQKAYDEMLATFKALKESADEFNKSFAETAKTFVATFKITPQLDEFAQSTVDAFDTIRASAKEAFDNKLITQSALNNLTAYADREQTLLMGIAKQRDNLAKKISIAQSITAGVMGSLNLTSMLDSETKTVTKAVTTMVNGIGLTVTSTFDEVVSGGLEANFKKLVDKTKTFATNLTKLKALGLNGNLFKQIVDAGAEGGNATAEAIIAGGASSVTELNSLFTQLSDAGNEIAKTSTDVMYNIGEEMTNGFIEGLRSEDQKLADAATALAGIFTSTFKAQIDSAIAGTVSLAASETVASKMKLDLASRPDPSKSPQRYAAWLQNIGGIDPIRSPQSYATQQNALMGNTYNVTVNAGAIANKTELPAIIVEALNTASKQGLSTRILNAI